METNSNAPRPVTTPVHRGSCHCGALRFEVKLDVGAGVTRCNCSICTKLATTGAIVKPEAFTALSDESHLGAYAWASKTATRFFCKTCGVHAYARGTLPQLGGAYVSINCNCLDDVDLGAAKVGYWDGRHNNWQSGMRDAPWAIFPA